MILLSLIILFGAMWSLAFYRINLKITTAILGALLLTYSIFVIWPIWLLIPAWIIYLSLAALFNIPALRRIYITSKLLNYFHHVQPPMSKTEQIALEAGDVWWEGELFCGAPNWKKLLTMPKPKLSAEEQEFIHQNAETICTMLDDWQIVQEDCDLSANAWNYLKDEGFFGLVINKKYGGHNFSALAHSTIVNKIATRSMSAAITTMVPNSLGPAELIALYGTDEQKKYFLPRLAKGKEIPCFGLTGLEAGSDATAISDKGIICRGEFNGKEILGIRLNWYKRYITLAPVASILGLAFKLYDPEHLLGEITDVGITLALIPTDLPGIEIGTRHLPSHLAFMNGPTRGTNVFIPLDWIIGGPEMRGKGWQMLMECLSIGRGISLPALGTAVTKLCFRTASAYAAVRKQFKMPIGKLEGIQENLAKIGGLTYICEATRIMTASAVDQGVRPSLASAITKYHLTELGRQVSNAAMDIHAGKAIQLGPNNYLGLMYDAIPTSITVEGANILTRNLIIFGQGAIRCHPYVREEIAAAQESDAKLSLEKFDRLIISHIGYAMRNFAKNLAYSLTGGIFIRAPQSPLAEYYRQLTRMSTALALTSDFTMALLGGALKRKERLSARLGDVLSYLYLASSVLRYYENQGQPASDILFVQWSVQWCLAKIQQAFDEFFTNLPRRWLGKILQWLIFPWGKSYCFPRDYLDQRVAEEMLKPSALRDRITAHTYLGKAGEKGIYILEQAFQLQAAAEPVKAKLQNAIRAGRLPRQASIEEQTQAALKAGILTADEIQLLRDAHAYYLAAIAVDEFDPKILARKRNNGRSKTKTQQYSDEKPTA